MGKISVMQDEVLKDELGNGYFYMKLLKKKIIGKSTIYSFKVYRDENKKVSGCVLEKSTNEGDKKYIFNLRFDETNPTLNNVTYRKIDVGYDHTFDIFKSDVMFNVKLRKEEINVLKEFDKLMWIDSSHSQSKSTLIDVYTDVIDTTERDDTMLDGVAITDFDTIHMVTKGFFAEIKPNTEHVEL